MGREFQFCGSFLYVMESGQIMWPKHTTIACFAGLALLLAVLRAVTSMAQPVGDRIGDTCRVIAIDETRNTDEWVLYARPILTDTPNPPQPDRNSQPTVNTRTASQTDPTAPDDSNRITLLFDREQVALLNAHQAGVDGDPHLWHEIEDSIGNRGYLLAIDPETGQSTLRDCP